MRFPTIFLLAITLSVSAAPVFRNPHPAAIPTQSVSTMLSADFNGDHHPDVMLVDPAGALAVFLSNGTGPFAAPVLTPITQATDDPGIGDVNRDGRLDVVVTDWNTFSAAVLFGNGDGSFTLGPTLVTGPAPGGAAVGDFNGDTFADIAIGKDSWDSSTNALLVYLGDGTGSFGSAINSGLTIEANKLFVADLNRDGTSDLLIDGWPSSCAAIANGDGTFTKKSTFTDGGDIGVADFNHDAIPDVAVAAGGSHDWFIEVLLGIGDGTFGSPTRYVAGYESDSLVVADVDADGNADLLAAGTHGSTVTVLRGSANGVFHAPQFFLSGPSTWKVVAGDFDRSGTIDFVTLDYNSELWALSFVRGNGNGTFQTYRAFHTNTTVPVSWPGGEAFGGTAADMNNDHHADVVVVQRRPSDYDADLVVLLGDGTGKLAAPLVTTTTRDAYPDLPRIAVGDLNHDGKNDVVAVSVSSYTPSAETFLGDGTGHFAPAIPVSVNAFGPIHLAHFDGDSHLDLLISHGYGAALYRGNGDGTFAAATELSGSMYSLFVGDLNGDARADFVSSWIRSTVAYLNDGTGNFTSIPVTGDEIEVAALADFNADDKLDLLFTTYTGTQMRFGNGDGTFGAPIAFTIRPVPEEVNPWLGTVATADVDRDGKLDVAFGSTIYLGNGDGTFRSTARFRTNGIDFITFADMDENGSPDLILNKRYADDVDVLTTYTTPDPTAPTSLTLTADKNAARYADYVTFTATVTGSEIPFGGAVLFQDNGTPIAIIAVDRDGKASLTQPFAVGAHDIVATYVGDENYLPSTATRHLDVAKALTAISISGSPNPQSKGWPVGVQVTFSANSLGSLAAERAKITLRDGDTPLNVTLYNGRVNIYTLDVGTHVLHADYPGSENYEPSTASYTQTITNPIPTMLFTADPSSTTPLAGTPISFHVYFQNAGSFTGTISFYDNGTLLATVPLTNNAADFQITPAAGQHTITMKYSGDDTWGPATRFVSLYAVLAWGSPIVVNAAESSGGVSVSWLRLNGAASYTVWRRTSLANGWESAGSYSGTTSSAWLSMPPNTSALFAVTATNGSGAVSPMSAPDLATNFSPQDPIVTIVRARHFTDLRTMIQCVRTFAGLAPFAYTHAIQAGQPVRAIDMRELRTALTQARNAIGLPAMTFTDNVLTPNASPIRSAHIMELRAGAN